MVPMILNPELERTIQSRVDLWGSLTPAVLRLFRNDFDPTPDSVAGDFMEANYAGYNAVLLGGELTAPAKVAAGWYESVSDQYLFPPPTVAPGNIVYGAWVTYLGDAVAAGRFAAPITMNIGSLPFKLRLRLTSKSESLFEVS